MLTAIVLSALVAGLPFVMPMLLGDTVVIIDDTGTQPQEPVFIYVRPEPPPTILPDEPVVPVTQSADPVLTGRVVPVSDSLMSEGPEVLLPTQTEIRISLGPGSEVGTLPIGLIISDTGESIPDPDVFVKMEIEPEMLEYYTPEYPRLAQQIGQTGVVWVKALVDPQGKVRNALVAKTSGSDLLDRAATEGAYKNAFKPGIQNGRAVHCWVTYRVEFRGSE